MTGEQAPSYAVFDAQTVSERATCFGDHATILSPSTSPIRSAWLLYRLPFHSEGWDRVCFCARVPRFIPKTMY